MKRKVVSFKNQATSLLPNMPSTLTYWIALDYFNASDFVWGIVGATWVIFYIIKIAAFFTQEQVDIFDK